jgi:type IV secretory pathway component VirB8
VLLSQIRARNWIWHAVVLFVTLADLALLVIAGRAIG